MYKRLTISGTREAKSNVTIFEVCGKLSDYEDSGLSPIEIKEIKRILDGYGSVFVITERLIDISKPDDFSSKFVRDGWAITEIPAFIGFLKSLKNIGHSVFFTREEAEKQLIKLTSEQI